MLHIVKRLVTLSALVALSLGLACLAQQVLPTRNQIGEFRHASWTTNDEMGAVFSVHQDTVGFLWITSSLGVRRFDGVTFESLRDISHGRINDNDVLSAFPSRQGGVWLVTRSAGMLLWRNNQLQEFPDRRCTPTVVGDGIAEAKDGSLWMQSAAGLSHLSGSQCTLLGSESGVPKGMPASVFVDDSDVVWIKASDGSLLVRKISAPKFQQWNSDLRLSSGVAHMHQAPDRSLWISDQDGIRQLTTSNGIPFHAAPIRKLGEFNAPFGDFTFEANGDAWIAAKGGLIHVPGPQPLQAVQQVKSIVPADGLSSTTLWRPFVDQSGGLWIGSNGGLDHFRRTLLKPIPTHGSSEDEFAVVATADATWFGNATTALTSIHADGTSKTYAPIKSVLTLRRDAHDRVWCASSQVPRLSYVESGMVHSVNYPEEASEPVLSIAFDRQDNPWIMTRGGNVFWLANGVWHDQSGILKKRPGVLGAMTSDADGTIWIAFSNKLFQWNGTTYHQFTVQDASLNVSVSTMAARNGHVWLAGRGGLVQFRDGVFHKPTWADTKFPGRISGVVESPSGDLWLNTFSGALHISDSEIREWMASDRHPLRALRLDANDGLPGLSSERIPEPSLVEAPNGGQLLFATTRGIASLALNDMKAQRQQLPPHAEITSITLGDAQLALSPRIEIPARPQRLIIHFTALGAIDSSRVHFRYRLSGVDDDWQDAGTIREASYTKLATGSHQFEVVSSEDGEHWSSAPGVLSLRVAPAFYQRWWFRCITILALVAVWFGLLHLRLRKERQKLHRLHLERLSERERIARELHDTLLQGIFALTLQLKALGDGMPSDSVLKADLERAIESSDKVIQEGRDRVRNLRMVKTGQESFQERIRVFAEELTAGHGHTVTAVVEGTPMELLTGTEDEILLVVAEAIRNAVMHANAHAIRITMRYTAHAFQTVIADDGTGIPEARMNGDVFRNHWGLQGMRERARALRGNLEIQRLPSRGTAIVLTLPASHAYRWSGLSWPRSLRAIVSGNRHTTGTHSKLHL